LILILIWSGFMDIKTTKTMYILYIELTISFLMGRKCRVNFRNQRLWCHNCRLYNNHFKDTQGHGWSCHAWFLRVIMSSSLALSCLPSVKKQKHDLIALFTVNFSHLYHNIIQHVCEAILGYFEGLARNCLTHVGLHCNAIDKN